MSYAFHDRRLKPASRPGKDALGWLAIVWSTSLISPVAVTADESSPEPVSQQVDFARQVYPLLKTHCFKCHAGLDPSSGVRLDQRATLLGETDGNSLVVTGNSAQSRLIELVSSQDDERMPPEGKGEPLASEQVALLRAWIDQGLAWDDALLPPLASAGKSDHWGFRPIERPEIPLAADNHWVGNPVDAFIAARHRKLGLHPAATAPRRILVRRLYLDMLGLPPTPAEAAEFDTDEAPDAYKRLVERVLASAHYGERWGRHWLDVARWAESEGFAMNGLRSSAWRYRDYVVRSFNDDKPFDEFVRQQISGDEMQPYSDENLIATGFLAAGRFSADDGNRSRQLNDLLNDMVNATGSAFLGLTIGCAQCHDHKFDPITQRDYYRFQGFFARGLPGNLLREPAPPADFETAWRQYDETMREIRGRIIGDEVQQLPEPVRDAMKPAGRRTAVEESLYRETISRLNFRLASNAIEKSMTEDEKKRFVAAKAALAAVTTNVAQTWGFYSPATSPHDVFSLPMEANFPLVFDKQDLSRTQSYLLLRGDVFQPKIPLEPGWPAVFGEGNPEALERQPRTALADWIVDKSNPLAARVWVNRIWHYHFGQGLVATPGNFGLRGAAPDNPELLDWLACELMDHRWSTKHIHRLIVGSNTYRQGGRFDAANAQIDPENHYLWRWRRRRLEAEGVRDAMLAVAGRLDRNLGGPAVPAEQRAASQRRGIYLLARRDDPDESLALFDGPTAIAESCAQRHVSTSPLQSLFLLNGELATRCARSVAERVLAAAGGDRQQQIDAAFAYVLNRTPDETERAAALRFIGEEIANPGDPRVVSVVLAPGSQADSAPARDDLWEVGTDAVPFTSDRGAGTIVSPQQQTHFSLHNTTGPTTFDNHTPDPAKAVVTYRFDRPVNVIDVEMIVHRNGITRIEGFVGDDPNELMSIGEATTAGATRGQPFAEEHSSHVFSFDPSRTRAGRYFRFIVRETALVNGFANYQAYPRRQDGARIYGDSTAAALVEFCQTLLNLNEFMYID